MQYLGPHAPVSQLVDIPELMYGMVASFDILMQNI